MISKILLIIKIEEKLGKYRIRLKFLLKYVRLNQSWDVLEKAGKLLPRVS
jgi:hypothetical protein